MKKISRMTLGTVQLGLNYGIANKEGKPSLQKSFDIMSSAIDKGVTSFDTAAGYGDSEKVIGSFLNENKSLKDTIHITTKFKAGKSQDISKTVRESVEKSLLNLGLDSIDLLLMHDAKEYSKDIEHEISNLLNEKLIKRAGASAYDFEDIEFMLDNDMFSAFQIPVNILDQRIIDKADKFENKTIFARSVYLQGLFFVDPKELKGNLREIKDYIKKVQTLAKEIDTTIAHLAMIYVNSLPFVDSLVVGSDNTDQLKENIDILSKPFYTSDMMEYIQKQLEGVPDWLFKPWLWDPQK